MSSYLKFLSRNKLYTAVESVGLVVSLAFVILIALATVMEVQMRHMVNRPTHLQTKDLFVIDKPCRIARQDHG